MLTRVPIQQPVGQRSRAGADVEHLHPEHPDLDPPVRRGKPRLDPPPPDYVAYKWRDGVYLGYDPSVPGARANYEKFQRCRARASERAREKRRTNPPPRAGGSARFRGWRWLCPTCGRKVHMLFLPLPRLALLTNQAIDLLRRHKEHDAVPPLPVRRERVGVRPGVRAGVRASSFACEKCLRLKRLGRTDPNAWNELICYLTGGLLYGREVERPAWIPKQRRSDAATERRRADDAIPSIQNSKSQILSRKIPYTPRPTREPSKRRGQIEAMLLAGLSFPEIARSLGLVKGTVLWYAQRIYRQHGVRTLPEFLKKLDHPEHANLLRGAHTAEIRRRLLAGESIPTIAAELGVKRMVIYNLRQRMRKEGVTLADGMKAYHARRKHCATIPKQS